MVTTVIGVVLLNLALRQGLTEREAFVVVGPQKSPVLRGLRICLKSHVRVESLPSALRRVESLQPTAISECSRYQGSFPWD